jgi:hypothetical protein
VVKSRSKKESLRSRARDLSTGDARSQSKGMRGGSKREAEWTAGHKLQTGGRAVQGAVGAEAKQERVWLGPDAGVCRCAVDVSVKESLSLSLARLLAGLPECVMSGLSI